MAHFFKSAVHLFMIKDNKILLQRRFNTGYMDGYYSVIAGHLEGNETASDGMIREAHEEAGIIIEIDNLQPVGVMHRKAADERIDFFFTASEWNGTPQILEPHKSDDLSWFDVDDLPGNIIPYVRRALANHFSNQWFDTFGFE